MQAQSTTLPYSASRPSTPPANLEALQILLDEEGWSGAALKHHLPTVLEQADDLAGCNRIDWLLGLREGWQRYGWALSGRERERLFDLARRWNDWQLLLAVGEALAQTRPLHPGERLGCCEALWHLGETEAAQKACRLLDWSEPGFAPASALCGALSGWGETLARHPLAPLDQVRSGPLRLEPLGHHHLPDFAWQYFDPDIAELCCLPTFESDDHWHRWIAENEGLGDQLSFALLHDDWGFVGSVNLIQYDGVGFVFYWIGADFRGHGLAAQGTALLLETARQATGLHTCYAKAFARNGASQRTLDKLGFELMTVRAEPPHDDEVFYRWGEAVDEQEGQEVLHGLLKAMGSNVVLSGASVPRSF